MKRTLPTLEENRKRQCIRQTQKVQKSLDAVEKIKEVLNETTVWAHLEGHEHAIAVYMETGKNPERLSLFGSMKVSEQAVMLLAVTLLVMGKAKATKKGKHMTVVRNEIIQFVKAFGWKKKPAAKREGLEDKLAAT